MTIPPRTGDPARESWTRDRRPDSSLFFRSPEQDRLLELLRHLAENTDQVILVCGEEGAGKTTLLYRLQAELPEHWSLCRLDAHPLLHPDQLLSNLARRLGVATGGERLPDRIAAAVSAQRLQGRLQLILLDDADQLPASSLMALLRLHEKHDGDLRDFALILLAHPRIDDTLNTDQLHAMGTGRFHRLDLPTLPLEQTADYIRHFLRLENAPQDIALSPEQLARVHRRSGGLPGRINEQVIQVLNEPGRRRARPRLPLALPGWLTGLPQVTLSVATAVALLLGLTLVFQNDINALFETPPQVSEKAVAPTATQALRVTATLPLPEPESKGAPSTPAPEAPPPTSVPLTLPTPAAEGYVEPDSKPTPPVEEEAFIDEPLIPPPEASENPKTPAAPAPATPPLAPPAAPPQPESPPELPAAAPKPEPPAPPAVPEASPALRADEQWLMGQDPANFSLQVLASGNEAAVRRYLERTRLPGRLVYFRSTRNGQPWFTVLHGSYPSRTAAQEALKGLPERMRKSGAWPRSLKSVQNAILGR
jgi:DamX protein